MSSKLTISLQCHNFQRRLCWMLSSLAQQKFPELITLSIAYIPGNGRPTTEQLCDLFSNTIHIRRTEFTDYHVFQRRGLIRNDHLRECQTDWLMFGDCDMVYHPEYFLRLIEELETNHKEARYITSSGRMSNPKDETEAMITKYVTDSAVQVLGAFSIADQLPKREMHNCGAGFCQIINTQFCAHDGYYVDPMTCRDWDWEKRGSNPKSDMQFRRRVSVNGGARRSLPHWFTETAIHLNHDRDPEAGKHLETQR